MAFIFDIDGSGQINQRQPLWSRYDMVGGVGAPTTSPYKRAPTLPPYRAPSGGDSPACSRRTRAGLKEGTARPGSPRVQLPRAEAEHQRRVGLWGMCPARRSRPSARATAHKRDRGFPRTQTTPAVPLEGVLPVAIPSRHACRS